MRVGDVDGKGVVYTVVAELDPGHDAVNFAADIILEDGERVISVYPNVFLDLTAGWGRTGGPIELPDLNHQKKRFDARIGVGSIFFTDRRIVFLRRPDPHEIGRVYNTPLEVADSVGDAIEARHILNRIGLEFAEIRLDDIARIEKRRKRRSYCLYLLSQNRRARLTISEEQMGNIRQHVRHLLPD